MHVELRIFDVLLYQDPMSHMRIFRVIELILHGYILNFFQKRYFWKRKKKLKKFIWILKNQ